MDFSLPKSERLHNKKEIDELFSSGESFSLFPLRLVFLLVDRPDASRVRVLCSVSKRSFKRAVDRNRIKRQLKEAYRLNKSNIIPYVPKEKSLLIAVIYTSRKKVQYAELETKLNTALERLQKKLNK